MLLFQRDRPLLKAQLRSSALRASGPHTARSASGWLATSSWPCIGTMPKVGLWPYTPQKCAGLRMEPPMSEPASNAVKPASCGASPEEPPGVETSQGLPVSHKLGCSFESRPDPPARWSYPKCAPLLEAAHGKTIAGSNIVSKSFDSQVAVVPSMT